MKILLRIFIIIIALASYAAASTPWETTCEVVLNNNQSTICSDYSITDIQFSAPLQAHFDLKLKTLVLNSLANQAVSFKVNHNNLTEIMLLTQDSPTVTTNNDAVQFSISKFTAPDSLLWEYSTYNPVATLTISHRQIPNISVSVKPGKAEYWSGSGQINWTVELKNNGGMDLSDVSLSYPNHDDIRIEVIKKDESVSKYLNEDIPVVRENTTHKFNVNVHFDMVISSEIETFLYTGSGTVSINPQRENIYLTKIIKSRTPTEDNTSFKSRIYTEDNTVTVSLANSGIYPISYIVVMDRYKSSGILHTWKLDRLPPGKSITFSYIVKPSQTGDFTSPASFANFMINGNFRDVSSNTVDVTVISMGKSIPISPDENYTEPIPTSIPISQDEVYTEPIPTSIPIFPDEVFTELTPIQTIAPIQPLPTIQPIPTTPGFSWVAGVMLLLAASLKRQEGSI